MTDRRSLWGLAAGIFGIFALTFVLLLGSCRGSDESAAGISARPFAAGSLSADQSGAWQARRAARDEARKWAYIEAVVRNEQQKAWLIAVAKAVAERRQSEEAAAARRPTHTSARRSEGVSGGGRCGGDLPPCWIMMRESGGDPRAQNPTSSASGKWQMLDSTWAGYGGYAHASDAPEEVQDAKARTMPLCHWTPPSYCAG